MKETSVISNYPRESGISLRDKLTLVNEARQQACGQTVIAIVMLGVTRRMIDHWNTMGLLFLCLISIIFVSTWLARRATTKLEAALGWRRGTTVLLTAISGLLTIFGGVILFAIASWTLHRNGVPFLLYRSSEDIQERIADLDEQKTLQS
ncbi:MAG TPA: hypothetical protein VK171_04440 [Fimbriimonas sp.]|nr:hypothetical protein [Fimbriimonas sp.]